MSASVLRAQNVVKAFQGVKALDGAGLDLREAEIHALMGENGAGKSTLIKVLTGVHKPDAGGIEMAGRAISPGSTREAEAAGISTVYQEVNLIPTLSIADNILLGRQPRTFGLLRKKALKKRAEAALARLGLKLDVGQTVGSCSMAVQQMVAIARALDIQAKVLILDEPTSSLDEREVEFLFGIMRKLRDEGMAILFVTHFLDQVYAVSDRITVLRNGKLVGEYLAADLPRLKLIGAMLGREFEEMEHLKEETAHSAPARKVFLETVNLSKRGLMNPVSLSIAEGEVLGLAGLLGSGRTEIAKMLFGIAVPDKGEIRIQGKQATIKSARQAVQHGLAFCSEDRKSEGLIPHLSVRENLILAMQASRGPLRLLPRKEQDRLAEHYIRALNIKTPNAEALIQNLSGGNQQKVLLARWLSMQPKLIILDEPTRGIDVGAKAEIEKLVHSLRAQGMSVLFISSDMEEIVRTCQRVAVLRDRKKIGELSGADIQVNRIMNVIAQHDE
ncbi:sugar ABC transporter ATP-binding protein [Pedosphaera parvula]|uniref:ABC transporter related-protein n=1 Tax=Pedosphaera parvula (strain Ellin514) TaxID=320771 RepID=B9XBB7_PEDPL|nr:sugar ABC transporter ATP-binding protein [Pedosphaera parvula]EEF62802.1 ABC transporter related-protein [Pedosphaera parvula Ellin514]